MSGKQLELCSTEDVAPGAALKVEIDDLEIGRASCRERVSVKV